ncbi:uncharacterized protein LOC111134953 isoform X1 [Crassostrea virginica]
MSSLCPGTLFSFPGFNKKSTPVPPQTTSEQLSKRYRREPFNGRPWPHSSPVAGVYDVGFSSTRMILFNNRKKKQGTKKVQSKLRGNNDSKSEESLTPDPNRHYRASSPVSRNLHTKCYNSMSPYYNEPKLIPWINYTERPAHTYEDGTMVNPKRHTSCCVPTDPLAFRVGVNEDRRPYSRASLPATFRSSPMLTHPDLKRGEKEYIGSIARIYSAQQMIKLKQKQYNQLLALEMEKGYHSPEEYKQYKKFIELGRRRQYVRPSRVMSAPADRWDRAFEESLYEDDKDEEEEEKPTKKPIASSSPRSKSPASRRSKTPVRAQSSQSGKSKGRQSTRETSWTKYSEKPETPSKPPPKQETKEEEPPKKEPSKQPIEEEKEESSDTSDSVPYSSDRNIHREGYDRPLSRLGHIPEDSKSQRSDQESTSKSESETKGKEEVTAQKSTEESDGQSSNSKSQKSDQESTSKSESETKGKEVTAQKSSTEESDGQSSSKTDTNIKSDQTKESSKSDSNTVTDDTPQNTTDTYQTTTTDTNQTKTDTYQTTTEDTTWSTDRERTKSDTDTDTATPQQSDREKRMESPKEESRIENGEPQKVSSGIEEKPSESDSYTDDFEKESPENSENVKKPPQSAEKVVSFRKSSESESLTEEQSPIKRKDSLSDDEVSSSKRDPDKLEY